MRDRLKLVALLTLLFLSTAAESHGQECGDLDNSGRITATDALLVLRKAVGTAEVTLQCPAVCSTTTTTQCQTFQDCTDPGDCECQSGMCTCVTLPTTTTTTPTTTTLSANPGAACESDAQCTGGLKCCYPCGIPGCSNECTAPDAGGSCPLFP